jgi:hypothetical protein
MGRWWRAVIFLGTALHLSGAVAHATLAALLGWQSITSWAVQFSVLIAIQISPDNTRESIGTGTFSREGCYSGIKREMAIGFGI